MMFPNDKVNLHSHTYYCRHGSGNVADHMVWAEKAGLRVLGFSEHVPLPGGLLPGTRMNVRLQPFFWREVEEAQARFPDIRILRAYEGEYIPELRNYLRELKEEWRLDYMILSNHFVWENGSPTEFPPTADVSLLKKAARQIIANLESGDGPFMAHPDLIFHHGCPWCAESKAVSRDIIECARACRIPLEINAYGMRKVTLTDADGVHRIRYPMRQFWELAGEIGGVEVVCNSDSHVPGAIVKKIPECLAWAEEFGLTVVNGKLAEALLRKSGKALPGADDGTRCAAAGRTDAWR